MFTSTSFKQDVVVRNYTLPSSLCLSLLMTTSWVACLVQAARYICRLVEITWAFMGAARILESNDWNSLPKQPSFRETPLGPGAKKNGCFRRL